LLRGIVDRGAVYPAWGLMDRNSLCFSIVIQDAQ